MNWLAAIAIGRLLVWVAQTSGPTKAIWKLHPFLTELAGCDFCIGCWIFTGMAWWMRCDILAPYSVPVLSQVVTGIALSFGVHLARLGWKQKWGYEVLE